MLEACAIPLDAANAATADWLGLIAIVGFVIVLCVITAWLRAKAKVEQLEAQLSEVAQLQLAGRHADASRRAVGLPLVGDIFNLHIRSEGPKA